MTYLLSIDTETTGVDAKTNSIIELGAILYEGSSKIEQFNLHIVSSGAVDLGALKVNKLNFNSLESSNFNSVGTNYVSRETPEAAIKTFCNFLLEKVVPKVQNKIVILGHSVEFDIRFIKQWFINQRITGFDVIFDHNVIDTKIISNFLKNCGLLPIDNISLGALAKALNITVDTTKLHTALYDCELTANCYFKMLDLVKGVKYV